MRIKTTKKVLIGTDKEPSKIGTVRDVDDNEAKALIAAGYAKETKEKLSAADADADAAEPTPVTAPAAAKDKGGAPSNKAK